jgi:hypothetical protein
MDFPGTNCMMLIWSCKALRVVIPVKAGIQVDETGFPRIKYGAGLLKSGMTVF